MVRLVKIKSVNVECPEIPVHQLHEVTPVHIAGLRDEYLRSAAVFHRCVEHGSPP